MSAMKKNKERKTCPDCGKAFRGRKNQKFCSKYCRFKYWSDRHPRIRTEETSAAKNGSKMDSIDSKSEYSQ